jgi:hypothetical protein
VWAGFAVVHLWIAFSGVVWIPSRVFWDLTLYRAWVWYGVNQGTWPVFDAPWVYPAGALVPITLVGELAGYNDTTFAIGWTLLVTALNAVAVQQLLRRERGTVGAWFFIGFLAALGPVSVGRLDAFVAPLCILGLLAVAQRPKVATLLLTIGAWIKVAPGALVLPIVLAAKRPWRDVVAPAGIVSVAVVAVVGALGGLGHVASFLFTQGNRGLQLESVGASPWLVAGVFSDSVARTFNYQIDTFEVHGPGVPTLVNVLDLVFGLSMLAVVALLWYRRPTGPRPMPSAEFVARGALLIMLTMIVTNKVLSPQYLTWLAAPAAVALATRLPGWRSTAWWLLGIGVATQAVFPWLYGGILSAQWGATLVLVGRNIALVVVLVATARTLVTSPSLHPAEAVAEEHPDQVPVPAARRSDSGGPVSAPA